MSTASVELVDRIVVGGGVIGLSVAYELARRESDVLVIERGSVGSGATAAAGGMLAPVSEADVLEPELIALGLDSLARYPDFVRGIERAAGRPCRFGRSGTIWVAVARDDQRELERLHETLALKGLTSEVWSAAQVLEREPHLSQRLIGGLYIERDHQIDPRALAAALAGAVQALGGKLRCETTVASVKPLGGGGYELSLRRVDEAPETLRCRQLVWAAGAWNDAALPAPLAAIAIRPVKGQLLRLRGPRLVERLVRTPEVYLIPRHDGELLIGATTEETGFETRPTAGAMMDLLRHAWQVLPGVYDLEFAEVSVGLRPALDDHLPRVGACDADGLFCAMGHYRHGVLLAPATAWYLADWMTSGREPAALSPFLPSRGPGAVAEAASRQGE